MQQAASPQRRRKARALGLTVIGCVLTGSAYADHAPAYVLPNPRGIPLIVDGVDVSGAVIEGDWGLYRPGHGAVTIYPEAHFAYPPPPPHYYPRTGRRPRAGRYEVETPEDRAPRPAQPYYRRWSAGSDDILSSGPPEAPPTVIEAVPEVRIPRRPYWPRPRR
jgi:hypothetical protein